MKKVILFASALMLVTSVSLKAQEPKKEGEKKEHKEHKEGEKKEHKEHKEKEGEKKEEKKADKPK